MKYLSLDCEMGGRDLKYSLLTAAFVVYDKDFNELDSLYLAVKPDDGDYIVNGGALAVNKINLAEHDKIAIPYKEAKPFLYNFLAKQVEWHPGGKSVVKPEHIERLVPLGHGVKGDIDHVFKLISRGSWEQFCTYHYIDTSVVLQFLKATGVIYDWVEGSIEKLSFHLGVCAQTAHGFHHALEDAKVTAKVYQKMLELSKK
jgi:hypothetical protein